MSALQEITVLIPGRLHEHAVQRIGKTFRLVRADKADPALLAPEVLKETRAVAAMTTIDAAFIDALPNLQIIANFGVGYDAVDARHAGTRGVMVTNTPDVLTEEVADTALGLLLNTVREFPKAEKWLRDGNWVAKGGYRLTPGTLRGRAVAWKPSACRSPITTAARSRASAIPTTRRCWRWPGRWTR